MDESAPASGAWILHPDWESTPWGVPNPSALSALAPNLFPGTPLPLLPPSSSSPLLTHPPPSSLTISPSLLPPRPGSPNWCPSAQRPGNRLDQWQPACQGATATSCNVLSAQFVSHVGICFCCGAKRELHGKLLAIPREPFFRARLPASILADDHDLVDDLKATRDFRPGEVLRGHSAAGALLPLHFRRQGLDA